MVLDPSIALDWHQAEPRIVQYQGRRFALRLERIYWQQLENIAERRSIRIGKLVAQLAQTCPTINLSSYVRGFCMAEAQRDLARYRLNAGAFDLVSILRGSPAAALILDENRTIMEVNQSLLNLIGHSKDEMTKDETDEKAIRLQKFDDFFTPRVLRPLDETIILMKQKQLQRAHIQISYKGRTFPALLTALPVGSYFYCLVWVGR